MILSLDTTTAIDLLRGRRTDVRRRYEAARRRGRTIVLSSIALSELAHGVRRSARPEAQARALDDLLTDVPVVEFDGEDAMTAGALRHELELPGTPIGDTDLLIAAHAVNRDWCLVTSNIRHFGRSRSLPLVDWRVSDEPLSFDDIIARLTGRIEDDNA